MTPPASAGAAGAPAPRIDPRPAPRAPARTPSRKPAPPQPKRSAGERRKPGLRVVAPPRARRHRLPFYILAGTVVGGLLVAVVVMQALVSQTQFRIQQLQQRTQVLQEDYGQLKLRAAELAAPEREAAAARKLGFVLPTQVVSLPVRGLPVPASPARPAGGGKPALALKGLLGGSP